MKRILALILVFCCLLVPSCGKKERKAETILLDHSWSKEEIAFPDSFRPGSLLSCSGDTVYTAGTEDGKIVLAATDVRSHETETISSDLSGTAVGLCAGENGFALLTPSADPLRGTETVTLSLLSLDGGILAQSDVSAYCPAEFTVITPWFDGESIGFYADGQIVTWDPGKNAFTVCPFDGTVYSVTVKDGVPCLYVMTKTGTTKLFTTQNGEPAEIPADLTSVYPDAVYRRKDALIAVDAAGAEEIGGGVLLDWSHSGIYYKGIRSMAFTDDGTCWTLLRNLTTGETELLCLSPSGEAAERIVVDALYAETGSRIVPVSAMLYNAAQDRVFVRCREVTSVSSENYDLSELNRLILSSREGDVLVFPEGYETYARRGLLYDLDSLMRTDSNVNRSSIYENALPPFEVNGTVYALTPVFRLEGIAMKEKNAGLSLGDLLRSHERRVLMTETKDAVSDLLLKHGVWDYLSPDLDSCAFDSPAFADCLGIIDSFPEENRSGRIPTSERPYENDRVLVAWAQIGSLTDYLEAKLLFGNEAVSFLGYPSSASGGEGGFVVSCRDTISVSSRTAVPEEAWEFVKFMLSGEALKAAGITNSGIPLLKSVSRDVVEGLMGEWSYDAESNWLDGRGMGGIPVSVDEACAEEYLALLEAARVDPAVPGQVDAILGEELSAFFAGARSAEETGRMIQNRIGNYLNERK
ncbi:MAG: hypothetical protein E7576_04040 [Ruminococcaceae bacterium]|nr:hypothetical protein [Oscillospiraceae bacterium]